MNFNIPPLTVTRRGTSKATSSELLLRRLARATTNESEASEDSCINGGVDNSILEDNEQRKPSKDYVPWFEPRALPLHGRPEGYGVYDPLRVTVEVRQALLRLEDVWGKPRDWFPPQGSERPLINHYRRAVDKVVRSVKSQAAQDAAQKSIFEWVEALSKEAPPPEHQPRTEEDVLVEVAHKTKFWSQLRSAATYGLKDSLEDDSCIPEIPIASPMPSRGHTPTIATSPHDTFRTQITTPKEKGALTDSRNMHGPDVDAVPSPWSAAAGKRGSKPTPPSPSTPGKCDEAARARNAKRALERDRERAKKGTEADPTSSIQRRSGRAPTASSLNSARNASTPLAHSHLIQTELPQLDRFSKPSTAPSGTSRAAHLQASRHATSKSIKSGTAPESATGYSRSDTREMSRSHTRHPSKLIKAAEAQLEAQLAEMKQKKEAEETVPIRAEELRPAVLGEYWLSPTLKDYFAAHLGRAELPVGYDFLVAEEATSVDLNNQRLNDTSLARLSTPVAQQRESLTQINLSNNCIVDGLQIFLAIVLQRPERIPLSPSVRLAALKLDTLDLSNNRLSWRSLRALAGSLSSRMLQVRRLLLCSIPMTAQALEDVCIGVLRNRHVKEVGLANIQCGRQRQDPCDAVARLCLEVATLDLSHNFFRAEGLQAIGRDLGSKAAVVRTLSLADNAGSNECEGNPLHIFCEALGDNRSLTCLDLSGCQLEESVAVNLEDSLMRHPMLERLDVSRTNLGTQGLRALLRTVAANTSKLNRVHTKNARLSPTSPQLRYNPASLAMEYRNTKSLQLSMAYHRSILRLLLQRAESFGMRPASAFRDATLDGVKWAVPHDKTSSGRWNIPVAGVLAFDFVLRIPAAVSESSCASDCVALLQSKKRTPVNLLRFVTLVRIWREQTLESERRSFLVAASRDLCYKVAQVKFFVREAMRTMPSLVPDLIAHFSTTLAHVHHSILVSTFHRSILTVAELGIKTPRKGHIRAVKEMKTLVNLNLDSLTGHHRLVLANPAEYSAADRLLLAANWEAQVAHKRKLIDTSELGNHMGMRNLALDGHRVTYNLDWTLPGDGFTANGLLTLDYVTPFVRPDPKTCKAIPPGHLEELILHTRGEGTDISEEARFQGLWLVAHRFYVDATQLRKILDAMPMSWRKDIYIILFARCVEFGSPLNQITKGVLHDLKHFSFDDVKEVIVRIGWPNVFDCMNFHKKGHNSFVFDLSKRDERICVCYLMKMVKREDGANFRNCRFSGNSELCDTGYWNIPTWWYTDMPTSGIVSITYACEDRHAMLHRRRDLARELLGWVVC